MAAPSRRVPSRYLEYRQVYRQHTVDGTVLAGTFWDNKKARTLTETGFRGLAGTGWDGYLVGGTGIEPVAPAV